MKSSQKAWIVLFLVGAAAMFYFGQHILIKHSDWAEFKTPAGMAYIFELGFSVTGTIAGALKIDLPGLMSSLHGDD